MSEKLSTTYCDVVIIDDMRYESEFRYFKRYYKGSVFVRVVRLDNDGKPYQNSLTEAQRYHISEVNLDSFASYGFFDHYLTIKEGLDNSYSKSVKLSYQILNPRKGFLK